MIVQPVIFYVLVQKFNISCCNVQTFISVYPIDIFLNSNITSNTCTDFLIVITIFCSFNKEETFLDQDNIKYNK